MWRNRLSVASILVLAVAFAGCGNGNDAPTLDPDAAVERPPRGMAWVIFDTDTVLAEVAETPEQRERGLMYRTELEEGRGMVFLFEDQEIRSFWMQNTLIPLDIAYLDRRQIIVDIQQMEPESEEMYESARPAQFALEVPQGWFAARGIEVGDQARIVRGR